MECYDYKFELLDLKSPVTLKNDARNIENFSLSTTSNHSRHYLKESNEPPPSSFFFKSISSIYKPKKIKLISLPIESKNTTSNRNQPQQQYQSFYLHSLFSLTPIVISNLNHEDKILKATIETQMMQILPPYGLFCAVTNFTHLLFGSRSSSDVEITNVINEEINNINNYDCINQNLYASILNECPDGFPFGEGHWDSLTNIAQRINLIELEGETLIEGFIKIFKIFKDEAIFGPLIGFKLNLILIVSQIIKERLIVRKNFAAFREARKTKEITQCFSRNKCGNAVSERLSDISFLSKFGGVNGAIKYIHANLISNSSSNKKTLIKTLNNVTIINSLIQSLNTSLELFRYEFDVYDESILTIDIIICAINTAQAWINQTKLIY